MAIYILNSLLLTLLCAIVNSQARTLTATAQPAGAADYHRPSTPPPPAPKAWTPTLVEILRINGRAEDEVPQPAVTGGGPSEECRDGRENPTPKVASGGMMVALGNFGKDGGGLPPPSPHHAPPTHEVTGGGALALRDYGKDSKVAPPAPHHAPPTHEVSGGGGAAGTAKEGRGKLAPPSPHHAPPTHEVSGGGAAAELERLMPYVLLSASA